MTSGGDCCFSKPCLVNPNSLFQPGTATRAEISYTEDFIQSDNEEFDQLDIE